MNSARNVDTVEEAELSYKATLMFVTKQRKKYPSVLAKRLGCSLRLETNAIEVMKVDLPPRNSLDNSHEFSQNCEQNSVVNYQDLLNNAVSEMHSQNLYMDRLVKGFQILNKNRDISSLFEI